MSRIVQIVAAALLLSGLAYADVLNMGGTRNADGSWTGLASLETVTVGNPGNPGEWAGESYGGGGGGYGPNRICGSVAYTYNIGKYEVTAGQYSEFLNAVAATDTYGLYNTNMWASGTGCRIQRTGSSGSYAYSVAPDSANRPVNYVSWGDAARFANWLHKGQPKGEQGAGTTETGAYTMNGATTNAELIAIMRNAGWKWAITNEDEWYKAAYYDPATGNYYDYPTGSNSLPSPLLGSPTDPGNNATYHNNGYTVGPPYWRTEVGAHENSNSPYGTFDQAGNVWEWNESVINDFNLGLCRGVRGGSLISSNSTLRAANRYHDSPTRENSDGGFRVVYVPEPAALTLLALGGLIGLRPRQA